MTKVYDKITKMKGNKIKTQNIKRIIEYEYE